MIVLTMVRMYTKKLLFLQFLLLKNEVNELKAERLARKANLLALVAATQHQPSYSPQSQPNYNPSPSSTRSQAAIRSKGKEIARAPSPPPEYETEIVNDTIYTPRDKEIDRLLTLISTSFKRIYKLYQQNLRTSSNTGTRLVVVGQHIVQQTGIQCYNYKGFGHTTRECRSAKRVNDSSYHKDKMLLYKQKEAWVQLSAEAQNWVQDLDEELTNQELEEHYLYIAKIQEVIPSTDKGTGPIFDKEPLEQVHIINEYNVFAMNNKNPQQPKYVNNTYVMKQCDSNTTRDSLNMSNNRGEANQDEQKFQEERVLLASLIEQIKCEIDENKKNNKSLESSNKNFQEANMSLAKQLERYKDMKYVKEAKTKYAIANGLVEETKIKYNTANMVVPDSDKTNRLAIESRSKTNKTGVNHTTSVSRPQLKSTRLRDKVLPNNSKVKNKSMNVEERRMNFKFSNNTKSCVLNDNHGGCVLYYINEVNSRTKKSLAVHISASEPKRVVNCSVATPHKKTVASDSTIRKYRSRHMTENLKFLINFVEKFLRTVRFGNDQFASNLGYGDWVQGNVIIKWVYYVEGLNHNLFLVGQFCDADLRLLSESQCALLKIFRETIYSLSKGYRVYNKRTRITVETIHVNFDELQKMMFDDNTIVLAPQRLMTNSEQHDLGPTLQCKQTLEHQRNEPSSFTHVQHNLPSADNTTTHSMSELELLFSPMFDEYFKGENEVVSKPSDVSDKSNAT
ncbi:hypothetical protein Tco_0266547 [Tanacetum coccineum]